MGYSCTAKASLVMNAVQSIMDRDNPQPDNCQAMLPSGFWERGREQPDGAITGTVWKTHRRYTNAERAAAAERMGHGCKPEWIRDPCIKGGSFKVSAEGKIVRFPQLTKAQKTEAEKAGAAAYTRRYENNYV